MKYKIINRYMEEDTANNVSVISGSEFPQGTSEKYPESFFMTSTLSPKLEFSWREITFATLYKEKEFPPGTETWEIQGHTIGLIK